MTTTDPLAEAVEAAARAIWPLWSNKRTWGEVGEDTRTFWTGLMTVALEAAAPLLREQTLAPVRALLDDYDRLEAYVPTADLRAALGDPT